MKISEVEAKLALLKLKIGDVPVVIDDDLDMFEIVSVVEREVEAICLTSPRKEGQSWEDRLEPRQCVVVS